jgi:hypothetical protein
MEHELAQAQGDLAYATGRMDLVLARIATLLSLPAEEFDPLEFQIATDELTLSRTIWSQAEQRFGELARAVRGQRQSSPGE